MSEEIDSNLEREFSKAVNEVLEEKRLAKAIFDESVALFIEKLRNVLEKDGGKFEIIEQSKSKGLLGGLRYRVEGAVVSSIVFGIIKLEREGYKTVHALAISVRDENTTEDNESAEVVSDSKAAVNALGKWMAEVAPEHVSKIKMPEEKKRDTFWRNLKKCIKLGH